MPLNWLSRKVHPRIVAGAAIVALVSGVLIGSYAARISQAVTLQVEFLGDPVPTDSWSCAVHLNNEDHFRTVTGTGNGEATFYSVQNILATCTKLSASIYSIGVGFKTMTGQELAGFSANPHITTNSWSRSNTA